MGYTAKREALKHELLHEALTNPKISLDRIDEIIDFILAGEGR